MLRVSSCIIELLLLISGNMSFLTELVLKKAEVWSGDRVGVTDALGSVASRALTWNVALCGIGCPLPRTKSTMIAVSSLLSQVSQMRPCFIIAAEIVILDQL